MTHTLLSPAKINWFLHITGRRDDGYHTLESVFQRIDWYDELLITLRHDGMIQLTGDSCGVVESKNLAHRAAIALKAYAQVQGKPTNTLGAQINLTKNIPTGAGLGGGSSNAATVLQALNVSWGFNFDNTQLQTIGLKLGADIPFFISNYSSAWAQGIGERLQPLSLPSRKILLVNPNVHVNTTAVFTNNSLQRNHEPLRNSLSELQTQLSEMPFQPTHSNDLEAVTFTLSHEVKAVHDSLASIAPTRMSGSGATVIACPMSITQHQSLQNWTATCPSNWQFRWVNTTP